MLAVTVSPTSLVFHYKLPRPLRSLFRHVLRKLTGSEIKLRNFSFTANHIAYGRNPIKFPGNLAPVPQNILPNGM